jgi:hypothetical protein
VTKIHQWSELEPDFTHGIILGNGASRSVSSTFSYSSLYDWASKKNLFTPNVTKVFKHLNTKDFELVLRILWHASHVNQALRVEEKVTDNVYKQVRSALVKAVRDTHVTYDIAKPFLCRIGEFLKKFSTVVSLNYDLIVYWTMLASNQEHGQWFKDCFLDGEFITDWKKLRHPYGKARGSTLVFYPHGSLALVSDLNGLETKIQTNDSSTLLETVVAKWESGKYSPVFVSEGTSKQKVAAIARSSYLNTVYQSVIPSLQPTLTIHGWSLSDPDDHILKGLRGDKIEEVAIAVHKKRASMEAKVQQIKHKIRTNLGNKTKVRFFDAGVQVAGKKS